MTDDKGSGQRQPWTGAVSWPRPAAPDRARLGVERWLERGRASDDPALERFAAATAADPHGRAMLDAVFGNSPFLTECLLREIAFVRGIVEQGFDAAFDRLLTALVEREAAQGDTARLMAALRVAKRRTALAAALADIASAWDLDRVCGALSAFADASLRLAVGHLAARDLPWARPGRHAGSAAEASGVIVLAMGKLGAGELNFSSDIDLIVLYDPAAASGDGDAGRHYVRLTRNLVSVMEQRTADGYVFRTDLRLRPDPAATPVALSVTAAESYYGSMALSWERAAMIKARSVAGDGAAADEFLAFIRQFVWRRHLDFAAIEDIHRMRRRIHDHHGHAATALNGHDLKLGRGGIRDIEFYVQAQQLIFGGRDASLRPAGTCAALRALAKADRITEAAADDLVECYGFLRRVEHRLQMIDDQQTHALPKRDEDLDALGVFLGFDGPAAFRARMREVLERVESRYVELFETGATADAAPAGLPLAWNEDSPETLNALEALGYAKPAEVVAAVRGWLYGRYRSTRSERARALLNRTLPGLLRALGRTAAPDAALFRFDEFLGRLPAGVQLFSLFSANPSLLDLVAEILGTSQPLADHLARNPALLDAVLTDGFLDELPGPETLAGGLGTVLADAAGYEDVLNALRRWTADQQFRAGLRILQDATADAEVRRFLSDVADTALRALQPHVTAAFSGAHGGFPDDGLSIVAMGKLGGHEMSIRSDLDLILVYRTEEGATSDGPKPLPSLLYFARLSQRLISAVTARTADGALFDVDMRLRPSGNAGPIATSLDGFRRYQQADAWTWEHMALTRARVITGPPALADVVAADIAAILRQPRDPVRLLRDVADMRRRIERSHPARDVWEVKHWRGGLVDIEFVAQYLQLREAYRNAAVLHQNTAEALSRLTAAGVLDGGARDDLQAALAVAARVQAFLRLTQNGPFDPAAASPAVRRGLCRAVLGDGSDADLVAAEDRLRHLTRRACERYVEIVEASAAALPPAGPAAEDEPPG